MIGEDAPHLGVGLWKNFAMVGSYGSGFNFIDLSEPGHLVVNERIGFQCCPQDYAVDGSILFAMSHSVASYELHVPLLPEPVALIPDTEGSQYLEVQGNLAYTARDYGDDFCIYDLTDPANPVLTGHEPLAHEFGGVLAITEGAGPIRYAYVGDGGSHDGFHILDISDPYGPFEVDFVPLGHSPSDLEVEGFILYVMAGHLGLMAYDISNPIEPLYLSNVTFGFSAQKVLAVGTMLYVGRRVHLDPGLIIVDASDPKSLKIVGSSTEPQQPYDFELHGDLLYIADGDGGLLIMDVGDPQNPTRVTRLRCARQTSALVVDGNLLYLLDLNDHSGFLVIDISDPTGPVLKGYYRATFGNDLALINGHMLVAAYHDPLVVAPLDCESSAAPGPIPARNDSLAPHLLCAANPCMGSTSIRLHLPQAACALMTVHDAQGRLLEEVHRGSLAAGMHVFRWDRRRQRRDGHAGLAGIYFVRLATQFDRLSQPLVVVR
jgi:hypothetical protein